MAASFNPYREWLGVEKPAHHYALLGVEAFEDDAAKISSAAVRRLAHLKGLQPGEHESEWRRLIREVEAAKKCLLEDAQKRHYDKLLREQVAAAKSSPDSASKPNASDEQNWAWPPGFGPPSSEPSKSAEAQQRGPTGGSARQLAAEFLGLPPKPIETTAEATPRNVRPDISKPRELSASRASARAIAPVESLTAASDLDAELPPAAGANVSPSGEAEDDEIAGDSFLRMIVIMGGITGVLLLALVIALFVRGRSNDDDAADSQLSQNSASDAVGSASQGDADNAKAGEFIESNRGASETRSVEVESPRSSVVSTLDLPRAGDGGAKVEPGSNEKAIVKPDQSSDMATKDDVAVADVKEDVEEVDVPRDEAAAARFRKSLEDVRSAVAFRDLDAAVEHLEIARGQAETEEEKSQLAMWEAAVAHVTDFWKLVRSGLGKLDALDELKIGNTIFIVVETSPEKLVIRLLGRNRAYKVIEELPVGIAKLVVEKAANPNSALFQLQLGTFLALDAKGNVEEGLELLRKASSGDERAKELAALVEGLSTSDRD